MDLKTKDRVTIRSVERQYQNILQMLEMLISEHIPLKQKMKMGAGMGWTPPTDVFETETELVVMVDIAGMEGKDISVVTDGKILTIQGVRKEVAPPGKKHFHKMEIQVGPFQRLIPLPSEVDIRSIATSYSKGFLEIRLKKSFEKSGKKKIKVE